MKVLILSCYTGEGHNSAARAVMEELQAHGIECEITDPVAFKSEKAQKFVSSFYNNMIKKTPAAFGALYKAGAIYDSTGITSPVYLLNAGYAENLNSYIEEKGYDTVICTHLYGMEVMTAIKKRLKKHIKSYGIFTDYTCIPFISETDLDGYFVPHESLKEEFCSKGYDKSIVFVTGIPVSPRFITEMKKDEAREILGMPQDKKIYLIMTGGVGCENITELCDEFLKKTDSGHIAYILTGRNDELKEKILSLYPDSRIVPVAFTDKVNIYMRASDVLLSKSGGLSSTEAAVSNIPFVSAKPIPGCETKNAMFFSSFGMSVKAENYTEAMDLAISLAEDEEKAEKIRESQRENINPYAARDIVLKVMENE